MRGIAEAIGWLVIIMFVLGVLDVAEFRLSFKAKDREQPCPTEDVKNKEEPATNHLAP